jgi:hypothetical protein
MDVIASSRSAPLAEQVRRLKIAPLGQGNIRKATQLPEPVVYPTTADRIGRLGSLAPLVTGFYVALDRINLSANLVTDADTSDSIKFSSRQIADLF